MSNGSDVGSALVDPKPPLSDDSMYRQLDHKKGILRWDVQVPPAATQISAAAIEYTLRLEYDKQMSITGIAMAEH